MHTLSLVANLPTGWRTCFALEKNSAEVCRVLHRVLRSEVQFLRRSNSMWICPVNLCLLLRKIRDMLLLGLFKWILSEKIIRGLQNKIKINILYVNYGAECLKVYTFVCSLKFFFFLQKSEQYTVFAIEIRKQRENSKLISSPLKNSIKFSVVYLRVSVTHFVPTGMFKLPPSSRPQISKGNL